MKFQDTTSLALNAHYMGSNWFDECSSLRFATAVTERNELFASTMEQYGHTYEFEAGAPNQAAETATTGSAEDAAEDVSEETDDEISSRTTINNVELEEVTIANEKISKNTSHDTMEWLTTVYWSSRGFELGTFDSSLIAITMKTQSARWEGLALGYISDVISMAHTFITDLLQLICPDVRVRDGLMSVMMEELMAKYESAIKNVRFLLHVERMGRPTTLNSGFHENLEERYITSCSMLQLSVRADKYPAAKTEHKMLLRASLLTTADMVPLSGSRMSSKSDRCQRWRVLYGAFTTSSSLTTRLPVNALWTMYGCRQQVTTS